MDTAVTPFLRGARRVWRLLTGPRLALGPAPARPGPGVLPAYAALARYRTGTAELEPRLRLLVSQLAAERSCCQWCIERGRHLWRESRLPAQLLRALRQYDRSSLFSAKEQAALQFADAVTRFSQHAGGIPTDPLTMVRQHFSEPEVAALTETVAEMHFFNPITGELGADAEPRSAWNLPLGSSIRNFWL